MRKLTVILLFLSIMSFPVFSDTKDSEKQENLTASTVFSELPISVLDLVDKSRRLDMLDYYAVDSIAEVPNNMEGLSHLDTVTPAYLNVVLTPVTELAVKILPGKKEPVILTAYTIGDMDQAYDTDLRFFDADYNELDRDKLIKLATLDNFFDYPDKETKNLVASLVPFPTVRYQPEPDGTGMSAELTVGQFMSSEDYARISKFLRGKLHYKWNGSKFNLEK